MSITQYHINDLINLDIDSIWGLPGGLGHVSEVTLESGEKVKTNTRQLSRAWYYWEFNRAYNVPVTRKQIIPLDSWYTNDTHIALLDAGLNTVYDALSEKNKWGTLKYKIKALFNLKRKLNKDELSITLLEIAELAVTISENIVNTVPKYLGEYVATVDLEDYRQIVNDKAIVEVKEQVKEEVPKAWSGVEKYKWIKKGYEVFEHRLEDGGQTDFRYNGLALMLNTNTLTKTQLRQSVMYRGYTTEIDSRFHPEPTLTSYVEGVDTIWDMAKVSRAGTKASYYAGEPVQDTEKGNRLHQIITSFLRNVHHGDCGSTTTYEVRLTDKNFRSYEGKFYLVDGEVYPILKTDKHLIGTVVHIRNPAGCNHPDHVGICSTCLGLVSESIPKNAIAGHALGVELWAVITQLVISVKHDDTSSVGEPPYKFNPRYEGRFLKLSSSGNEIELKEEVDLSGVWVSFNGKETPYLGDVITTKDVFGLSPHLISELSEISLTYPDRDGIDQDMRVVLQKGKSGVSLTNHFLNYLKNHPECHTETKKAKYTIHKIDLSQWDKSLPFLQLPFKHYNMLDFHTDITRFIESKELKAGRQTVQSYKNQSSPKVKLTDYTHFGRAVQAFKDVMDHPKFQNMNIAILELAIYGFGIMRSEDNQISLLKNTTTGEFISLNQALKQHSITTHLIYEQQNTIFQDPLNYTQTKKVGHAYDLQILGKVSF